MTMAISDIAKKVESLGGRAFLVGGAVRDEILGRPNHDEDIVVVGVSVENFQRAFPKACQTGKLFPVWRIGEVEVAMARRERKIAEGHNGFSVDFDPSVSLVDDLRRRDLTMNAIAKDVLTGEIVDPFGGACDAKNGILREVDAVAFKEDPLRVLRVARFASQMGFIVSASLFLLMRDKALLAEVSKLPHARIWGEMRKALESQKPSAFFRILAKVGALKSVFPELDALRGQTQPVENHPEGDAFEHSLLVLDSVARMTASLEARFAALTHDLGKGATPKELLPRHHAHDVAGAQIIEKMNSERFPRRLKKVAKCVARWHMVSHNLDKARAEGHLPVDGMFNVLEAVQNADCVEAFRCVCLADGSDVDWWLSTISAVFAPLASDEIPVKGDIRGQVIAIRKKRIRQAFSA